MPEIQHTHGKSSTGTHRSCDPKLLQLAANLIKDGLAPGTLLVSDHETLMLVGLTPLHGGSLLLLGSKGVQLLAVREARRWLALGVLRWP